MKFKQFLFAAFIAAFAGMAMVGCNENDPNDPGTGDGPDPVTSLQAVSLSNTMVGLKWTGSTGADEYEVTVTTSASTTPFSDTTVSGTSVDIGGLTAGTIYTFSVVAVDTDLASSDDRSTATTVVWSPAWRFNSDSRANSVLRLYPRQVTGNFKGSGIVITAAGAYNASVAGTPATNPELENIHLLADVDSGGAAFTIGAPNAVAFGPSGSKFTNFNNFRQNAQVSSTFEEVSSLDSWYRSQSLEPLFSSTAANSFQFGDKLASNLGVAFALRWGSPGSYRYARVFVVPSASGQLIQQDSGGDRYIEVRISYQDAAGVPYAKGS